MKRFILLFVMAVFIIMATSCMGGTSVQPAAQVTDNIPPQYQKVIIISMGPNSHGKKPEVAPRCAELRYGKKYNEQVKWIIPSGLEFTITFDKNESPFKKSVFTNKDDTSQPVVSGAILKAPGEKDKVYFYSLEVEGHDKLDPAVIVWQ